MSLPNDRFYELARELVKIVDEAQEDAQQIDATNIFHRLEHGESMISALIWLNAQLLKELAARDGFDVTDPPATIRVVGEVPV